jgi:hypothetical protein
MRGTVLVAWVVVFVPVDSHAQGAADEKAAAEAFERGKGLHEKRNYVEAIEAFEVAYRLRAHHIVQCSIARCYENLNKPIEAAAHFKRCLADGAEGTDLGPQVSASLARMEARIVQVEVSSPGKGGTIHVDGRQHGEAPQTLRLNPGSHVIEVRREGARPASATVKLLGGERRSVTLIPVDLRVEAPASAPIDTEERRERPRRRLSQVWFWSAAGVTAALAITTTVLGVQTLGLKSDFEDNPTEQGASDFWDRRRLTNILLGATLAAAATGTTLFFFTDFGGGAEATRGASAGIGLRGAF